jgi:hypothetical protein
MGEEQPFNIGLFDPDEEYVGIIAVNYTKPLLDTRTHRLF